MNNIKPYTHCPRCGHSCFDVEGRADLRVAFDPGDPDGQSDCVGWDWTDNSQATCSSCGYVDFLRQMHHDKPFVKSDVIERPLIELLRDARDQVASDGSSSKLVAELDQAVLKLGEQP